MIIIHDTEELIIYLKILAHGLGMPRYINGVNVPLHYGEKEAFDAINLAIQNYYKRGAK